MTQSFGDLLAFWALVLSPLAVWILLFWLTHRDSYTTKHQKELMSHIGNMNRSLDRIAGGSEKNSSR